MFTKFRLKIQRKKSAKLRKHNVFVVGKRRKLPRIGFLVRKIITKKILLIILPVLFIIICLGAIKYFLLSDKFRLETVTIEGNEQVSSELVISKVSSLINKNIFLIRPSRIKSDLLDESPYIKQVWVEKKLPNTLIIQIEERSSKYVWINFNGAFLIDDVGYVIDKVATFTGLDLSSQEKDILKGYVDVEKIKEDMNTTTTINEESTDTQEQEVVSQSEEINVLEEINQVKSEVTSKVEAFWEKNSGSISVYLQTYQAVFSYEDEDYTLSSLIDKQELGVISMIMNIDLNNYVVEKYICVSPFKYIMQVNGNRQIIFTSTRDVKTQEEELLKILERIALEGKDFYLIDLSTKKSVIGFK